MSALRAYLSLTKPGIIRGNAVTFLAGFFLASKDSVNLITLLLSLAGLSLIIASACTFNNYIDRDIDKLMARTKNRALAAGQLPAKSVLIFAATLLAAGTLIMLLGVNLPATLAGLFGFLIYVFAYTYLKRHSVHATLIGAFAGAAPPITGYLAVSGSLDLAAKILFFMLVFWQMPHFYAIAIYRIKEYRAAKIPVLPIIKGYPATKQQIIFYIVLFWASSAGLSYFGYTSSVFAALVSLISIIWLCIGIRGFTEKIDNSRWSRQMFFYSLFVITFVSTAISIDSLIS